METVDHPSDYGFSRRYLWSHLQDHRTPPAAARTARSELRRHLSFATRAPSSPELRRHLSVSIRALSSPELRRQPSFATGDPPFSELHLHPSFIVTCALRREFLLHRRFVVTGRHLSSSTKAPPSSELHLCLELHPCQRFRAPPSPELSRHPSIATRAQPFI